MAITVTVDAIAKYKNGIVLVERAHEPLGLALPGGHVNEGESLEAAIRRELKEETNLNINSMEQFRTYSDPNRDPRGHVISTVFMCDAYGQIKAGDDAKKTRVISIDDIAGLKDEFAFDHYSILTDYVSSMQKATSPGQKEDELWEVHYMSGYFDDGWVPVDERYYFVADSRKEAMEKAYKHAPKLKNLKSGEEIVARPLPLENLYAARDAKNDGRGGWHSTRDLSRVELSTEEERDKYTLGVSLVKR